MGWLPSLTQRLKIASDGLAGIPWRPDRGEHGDSVRSRRHDLRDALRRHPPDRNQRGRRGGADRLNKLEPSARAVGVTACVEHVACNEVVDVGSRSLRLGRLGDRMDRRTEHGIVPQELSRCPHRYGPTTHMPPARPHRE